MVGTVVQAFLTLVGAALVLIGELLADDPKRKARRRTMVLVGGGLVAAVAFVATIEQARQQSRIETLTGETRDLVTGGDSFVWLLLFPVSVDPDRFSITAFQGGDDVPAFDVNVRIEETGQCDGIEPWTMRRVMATGVNDPRHQYLPAVTSGIFHQLQVRLEPSCDDAYYLAYIYTRNRVTLQQTLMFKRNGGWRQAHRLIDVETTAELHSRIDADVAAEVQWPELPESRDQLLELLQRIRE